MVRELDAGGSHYRDIIPSIEFRGSEMRKLTFRIDVSNEETIKGLLNALGELAQYPHFDARSFLIRNALNTDGGKVNILLVPDRCPMLTPDKYPATDDLPKEGETFVAEAIRTAAECKPLAVLVLARCKDDAVRIAKRRVSDKLGCNNREIEATVRMVTPAEFIELAKKMINEGGHLPEFIMRFGGLKRYASELGLRTVPLED